MTNKVWLRGVWSSTDEEELTLGFVLAWSVDGVGVGEFTFKYDVDADSWTCDTETMNREFVKGVLAILGDTYKEDKEP